MSQVLKVRVSRKYPKDLDVLRESGRDISKLEPLVALLRQGKPLPPRCLDHPLVGDLRNFRDAHVDEPDDWVLVYRVIGGVLLLYRTGTHARVFRGSGSSWHRRQKRPQ